MILRRPPFFRGILFGLIASLFASCNDQKGFSSTSDGMVKRLDKFGDCSPSLHDAAHFIMHVRFESLDHPEKKYEFQLHHHSLHQLHLKANEDSLYRGLTSELLRMNCGDAITLRLPFHHFDRNFLSAYADESMYDKNENMELSLEVVQTFETGEYADYVMSASQQGEIGENEAIELLLMNETEQEFEKHGDCYIQYFAKGIGDTIAVGDEVVLAYNTFLLNGKKLDEPTELQLNYGMPGQVVDGLHYALSFMHKGDEALVYMPSYLAFGTQGSSSGVVPRNTPIYFRIRLS